MNGRLVEEVFAIQDRLEMARAFFPIVDNIDSFQYAHCIYLAGEKDLFVDGYFFDDDDDWGPRTPGFRSHFQEYLEAAKPVRFKDYLFLTDLYRLVLDRLSPKDLSASDLVELSERKFDPVPIVDEILEDSRGFLLWRWQLESLVRAFYCEQDRVLRLCRGINNNLCNAWDETHSLKFGTRSLYSILVERRALPFTILPNIKGAVLLYNSKSPLHDDKTLG